MSGPEASRTPALAAARDEGEAVMRRRPARTPLSFGTIVVIGGGCYGSYYVRQLARAREAGAVSWRSVLVVDRDPGCRVASAARSAGIGFECAPWAEFLSGFLGAAAGAPAGIHPDSIGDATAGDAIVPSPLMPHLLFEWLLSRARDRWPGRGVTVRPLGAPPAVPWQRAAPDGTAHYVSFAEWMCPINCIEPLRCPVTRGRRDWTMPAALTAYVTAQRESGHVLEGPLVFHCTHRAFGVGMIDVRDVLLADRHVATVARDATADFLVGTVSHCHGALGVLSIAG